MDVAGTNDKECIFSDDKAQACVSVVIFLFPDIFWRRSRNATPLPIMSLRIEGSVSCVVGLLATRCWPLCRLLEHLQQNWRAEGLLTRSYAT